MSLSSVTIEEFTAMETKVTNAYVATQRHHVEDVVYACTSGSFIKGAGRDVAISQEVSRTAQCSAIVTVIAI
ncbi:MAG: hypothetical protein N3D85_03955 [Candidatus Bathyarchaeota archaeon]|nr:hypothetical protein [Candidatus Bathyarchaeota archaeon]